MVGEGVGILSCFAGALDPCHSAASWGAVVSREEITPFGGRGSFLWTE